MYDLFKKYFLRIINTIKNQGLKTYLKNLNLRILIFIDLIQFLRKTKKYDQNSNLESLVGLVFNHLRAVKPFQVRVEILKLLDIIKKLRPEYFLEIGTAMGATLFLFSRVIAEDAVIISVDLPGGKYGGGYPEWKISLFKRYILPKQKLYLIRADSHQKSTLEKVKKVLNGEKIDYLFIDGDHTYEGVKKDFTMYSPLVSGIVALHDIAHHRPDANVHVDEFWREIKRSFDSEEIIENPNQKWAGIGIIRI